MTMTDSDFAALEAKKAKRDAWHFSKEISIATILAVAAMAASGLWQIADIKRENEVTKVRLEEMEKAQNRKERMDEASIAELKAIILRLDQKVERYLLTESKERRQ